MLQSRLYFLIALLVVVCVRADEYNQTFTFEGIKTEKFPPRKTLQDMPAGYQGFYWTEMQVARVKDTNCAIMSNRDASWIALPEPSSRSGSLESFTLRSFYAGCYGGVPLRPMACNIRLSGFNTLGDIVAVELYRYKPFDTEDEHLPGAIFQVGPDFEDIAALEAIPFNRSPNTLYAYMTHINLTMVTRSQNKRSSKFFG